MVQPTPTSSGLALRPGDFANLPESLDYAARGSSGITLYSGRGEISEVLSYRDLRQQSLALAGKMRRAGLRRGDRVALIAETEGDFVRLFFACQYAGLVPAPMPLPLAFGGGAAYRAHIRRMIEAADASAAFAPGALGPWLAEAVEGLSLVMSGTIEDLAALPEDGDGCAAAPDDDIAYLQFSSGSTRFPTGVAVTQRALMSNVRGIIRDGLAVRRGDRCTSWLPMYHDMGLVGFLLAPMAAQLSLDLLPTREFARRPLTWPSLITRNGGTLSFSPSFGYELCTRRAETAALDGIDLASWRVAGIGGDMIRTKVLERFAAAFHGVGFRDSAFVASYGMAEATLAVSFAPLGRGLAADRLDIDRLERDGAAVPATLEGSRARDFARCGRALPGHELQVRGPNSERLPDRRVGRIYLQGPSLMREYYRQPLVTQATIGPDGWLDTGDLGYTVDGEVVITGRAKDMILVNGRNIAPQDLEWTVEHQVEGVKDGDAAAFSVDDEEAESAVLLVQCRATDAARRNSVQMDVEAVIRKVHGVECRAILVPHNSLPHTSSGKLSRSRARQLYLENVFDVPEAAGARRMKQAPVAAVTGGTGFLGRWIVRALADAGWRPRLLVRRDPVHAQLLDVDYEIVPGDLGDRQSLHRLVSGADVIVHAAGAIKALDRRAFFVANSEATERLARAAAEAAPRARFVLVSSLAAREPGLSAYSASKFAAERALRDHGPDDWVAVRPSAVYGPWDRETFTIFDAATGPLITVPAVAGSRVCLVHAADAAAAVVALCRAGTARRVYEVSDHRHDGYDWLTIASEALRAVAGRARVVRVPALALRAAGVLAGAAATVRRRPAMLTAAKARELLHADWSSAPERQPPVQIWRPVVDLRTGFAETADWYRRNGWLRDAASRIP